jgi:hypothetical protein
MWLLCKGILDGRHDQEKMQRVRTSQDMHADNAAVQQVHMLLCSSLQIQYNALAYAPAQHTSHFAPI